jgi:glycosyltransferase involved in cell wall biosynthesis
VANQTFKDWELLIIDDGSKDDTEGMVKKWQVADSRIHFFKRPTDRKKGASTCRNIGIENAKGSFIAFLDSDDEWHDDRLAACVEYMTTNQVKALYSGAEVRGKLASYLRPSRELGNGESLFDFLLKNDSFMPTPSLVVDTAIAKKVKFNEELRQHEDYDFILKVGEYSPWSFFEDYGVIVHWEQNQNKPIDYKSCLWFYEVYRSRSKDRQARFNYLAYMVEDMAMKGPPFPFLNDYQKIMTDEGFRLGIRLRVLFTSPYLFCLLLRIRSLIKKR